MLTIWPPVLQIRLNTSGISTLLLVCVSLIFGEYRWELKSPFPTTESIMSLAYGAERFVAVGRTGTIICSTDGKNWKPAYVGESYYLPAVAFGNGLFVAASSKGTVFTSRDGMNWTKHVIDTTFNMRDIAFGNGRFIANGNFKEMFFSEDGAAWSRLAQDDPSNAGRIEFCNNQFITFHIPSDDSDKHAMYTSSDGSVWEKHVFQPEDGIIAMAWGGGRCVAAGRETIYESIDLETWSILDSPVIDLQTACHVMLKPIISDPARRTGYSSFE